MDHLQLSEEKEFIGEEFLSWLWYKSEADGGEFTLPEGQRIGVIFDDYLNLTTVNDDGGVNTLRKGSPGQSPEALTAFRNGKRVTKAKLIIGSPAGQWEFKFDAETFDFQSVKTPDTDSTHPDDRLNDRLSHLEELVGFMEGLYRLFLDLRLTSAWDEEVLPAMRAWANPAVPV